MSKEITLTPVFRLRPNRLDESDESNESNGIATADIKFIDNITETQKLGDEPVDLYVSAKVKETYNSHTDYLGNIDNYDITVKGYRNNMTGNYMIQTKLMPICSINFMYSKNIVTGYLFNIHLYFILDSLKNHFLKTAKSYVGAHIYGRYFIILETNGEIKYDELEKKIEKYALEDVAEEISKNNLNLSENEMTNMLEKNIEEKKAFYKKIVDGYYLTSFKNIRKTFDEELIPLYKNKHINGLIKFGLELRQLKRQKEYGINLDRMNIPTKVLKLSDYKDNPDLIDKYLGIESSESDED